MQEMNVGTIERYFNFIRGHVTEDNRFYCCNRIEKKLVGGETLRIDDFPWNSQDKHLIDEKCPWRKYLLYHRKTSERGMTIGKWRVPFINYPDGDLKHRLTIMASTEGKLEKIV